MKNFFTVILYLIFRRGLSALCGEYKMNKEWVFEDIKVESYAGYKGEESPRAFIHLERRYGIVEIFDRWYEGSLDPAALRHDYFKVKTPGGEIFLIRHTPRYQSWSLCRHVPAPRFSNN